MAVYQSSRGGAFTYVIPGQTVGGKYLVRLQFSEPQYWLVAWRKQNVTINGVKVLEFNIGGTAGGKQNTAVVKDFPQHYAQRKGRNRASVQRRRDLWRLVERPGNHSQLARKWEPLSHPKSGLRCIPEDASSAILTMETAKASNWH